MTVARTGHLSALRSNCCQPSVCVPRLPAARCVNMLPACPMPNSTRWRAGSAMPQWRWRARVRAARRHPPCRPMRSRGPTGTAGAPVRAQRRFQEAAMAGLAAADVPKLELKWAFGFADAIRANAQPTIVGGRLFVGSATGKVYALDARTGCTFWEFSAYAPVRTAISVRPDPRGWMAYFGDQSGNAYGVDVTTGQQVWSSRVDPHPTAMVTGAPTVHGDMVAGAGGFARRGRRDAPGLCLLHLPRQHRRARRVHRQTSVAVVHHRRRTGGHAQERTRRATLRPVGRIGLVVTDGRSGQAPGLCDHRQQLLRPALGWRQRLHRLQAR